MKTEKGITLISILIYVIAMVIVIAVIASLTGYFYTNIDINTESQDIRKQYTKFNSFFTDDINKSGNIIIDSDIESENPYIVFANKNQYTFIKNNKAIYFNRIKIATNIDKCTFETQIKNGKNVIIVNIEAKDFQKTTEYTIRD